MELVISSRMSHVSINFPGMSHILNELVMCMNESSLYRMSDVSKYCEGMKNESYLSGISLVCKD